MTTTSNPLNETALERELRFIDQHIDRLEVLQEKYDLLGSELQLDHPNEDRRRAIHEVMTDLERELVLLEACYDRKAKLEAQG